PVSNRYTGQISDDETGLYYYGARYYDPQLGRFIQPDPTIPDPGSSQSYNRYSYCRNNPLNAVDPSGLDDDGTDPGLGGTNGNGVVCAYTYYANSSRLQDTTAGTATTNYQNLSYRYDTVSDVKSVNDAVHTTGSASASLSSIVYDDLYRLTSL